MAEETDREATRVRLLAMAADYEARAATDTELTQEQPEEVVSESVEPARDEPPKVRLAGKISKGLKETIVIERRPVGRPRRE